MATTADATQKALEEFDNRARELWKRAQLDKKRAKPTPRTLTREVVERKLQEALQGMVTDGSRLPFVINACATQTNVPRKEEALRFFLKTITPEQLEKLQSILTPMQIECVNKALELYRKTRLDELLESFQKTKLDEALESFRKTGKFAL